MGDLKTHGESLKDHAHDGRALACVVCDDTYLRRLRGQVSCSGRFFLCESLPFLDPWPADRVGHFGDTILHLSCRQSFGSFCIMSAFMAGSLS